MYRESIRNSYDQFAPGYRRIADYLLMHYQDAGFMTAAEIGRQARVDTALVVRFAQRLGYPGFPELLSDVQDDIKRDLRAVYEPPAGDNSPGQMVRRNLMQDRNDLDYMLLHYDDAAVVRVITALTQARRIYVIGEGSTAFLAEAFVVRLVALGYQAHLMSNEIMGQAAVGASMQNGDVFVGVMMTALSPSVSVAVKMAREAGVYTVGVVGALNNPIAAVVDAVLLAPANSMGPMPSWSAIAALLQGLTQAIALQNREPAANWLLNSDHYRQLVLATLKVQLEGIRDTLQTFSSAPEPSLQNVGATPS